MVDVGSGFLFSIAFAFEKILLTAPTTSSALSVTVLSTGEDFLVTSTFLVWEVFIVCVGSSIICAGNTVAVTFSNVSSTKFTRTSCIPDSCKIFPASTLADGKSNLFAEKISPTFNSSA